MEIWKDIIGYEGLYKVSNLGNIMSLEKHIINHSDKRIQIRPPRLLKQHKNQFGYMKVWLYKNSKRKEYAVHRLVASAFIDNPDNKPCVNHIDNNRENNNANNLEWCTYKENSQWAEIQGRREFTKEWREKISATRKKKPVIGINDKGEQIYFDTIRNVTKGGFDAKAVINCCKEKQNSHKGYRWNYFMPADKENTDEKE
jgi:hypothetical protein